MHAAKALSNCAWIAVWALEDPTAPNPAPPSAPLAANRPAQPCTEGRRQRRRTEPAKISSLHLVCHGLLGELPTSRLIVLETCAGT
jgi:hypothetical protein